MTWQALVFAATLSSAGCTSSTPAPVCQDHVVPASTDLGQPAAHFRSDVIPLFVQSCAFTSCHGNPGGGSSGLFLGTKDGATDPATVYKSIVGVAAPELPTMSLVAGGNPKGSFLMRKLDGDHCMLDKACKEGSCGGAMPRTGEILPVEERDKVRRWIAQGAKDD